MELAKPVTGTRVPAPPYLASWSYQPRAVRAAERKISVTETAVRASGRDSPQPWYTSPKNCPSVQMLPPNRKAKQQSFPTGEGGEAAFTRRPYSSCPWCSSYTYIYCPARPPIPGARRFFWKTGLQNRGKAPIIKAGSAGTAGANQLGGIVNERFCVPYPHQGGFRQGDRGPGGRPGQGAGRHQGAGALRRRQRQEERPAGPGLRLPGAGRHPLCDPGRRGAQPPSCPWCTRASTCAKRRAWTSSWPWGAASVIDSSKAIGYGLANDFDVWDLFDRKNTAAGCAPIGAVLTIAAAGSEMSDSTVITKDEGMLKRGYNSSYCRCRFAVMDPELTYTLPAYQTASGVTDIMMHILERYLVKEETMEVTDTMAEAVLRGGAQVRRGPQGRPEKLQGPGGDHVGRQPGPQRAFELRRPGGRLGQPPDRDGAQRHVRRGPRGPAWPRSGAAGPGTCWTRSRSASPSWPTTSAAWRIPATPRPTPSRASRIWRTSSALSTCPPTSVSWVSTPLTEEQIEELAEKCTYFGQRTVGRFKVLQKED